MTERLQVVNQISHKAHRQKTPLSQNYREKPTTIEEKDEKKDDSGKNLQ